MNSPSHSIKKAKHFQLYTFDSYSSTIVLFTHYTSMLSFKFILFVLQKKSFLKFSYSQLSSFCSRFSFLPPTLPLLYHHSSRQSWIYGDDFPLHNTPSPFFLPLFVRLLKIYERTEKKTFRHYHKFLIIMLRVILISNVFYTHFHFSRSLCSFFLWIFSERARSARVWARNVVLCNVRSWR